MKKTWVVIAAFVLGGVLGAVLGLQVSNFGARIEKIETTSASLESKIGDLESRTQRLGDLEGRLVKLEDALEELNVTTCAGLDELRADVDDLKKAVADLEASLEAVSARQDEADSKIQGLSAGIEALKADIDGKIASLRSEFDGKLSGLAGELSSVKTEVSKLSAGLLKVGYVDLGKIIDSIWASQPEWSAVTEKEDAIKELKAQKNRGEITDEEYNLKLNVLNVELLLAKHGVYTALLERMIVAPAFGDVKGRLEVLKEQMEILSADLQGLLEEAKAGVVDAEAFASKLESLREQVTEIKGTVEGFLFTKVSEAAGTVAEEKGISLVLSYDPELVLYKAALVEDLTELVKAKVGELLSGA